MQSLLLLADCSIRVGPAIAVVLRNIRLCISHKLDFSGPYTFTPLLSACHGQTGEKADVFFSLKPCLSLMKVSSGPRSK